MYTMMIVDDEEAIHQAIKIFLKWEDYRVTKILDAYDGVSAWDLLKTMHIDLMLVDIKMPNMNGLELIEKSQQLDNVPKSIIISGYDDFSYMQFAVRAKVEDYLLKPLNRLDFQETIQNVMKQLESSDLKAEAIDQQNQENGAISTPLSYEQFFKDIIYSEQETILIQQHSFMQLFEMKDYVYQVAVICMMNFVKVCETVFSGDSFSASIAFCNIINEQCKKIGIGYAFKDDKRKGTVILILGYPKHTEERIIETILKRTLDLLYEMFHAKSLVGLSLRQKTFLEIRQGYHYANQVLEQINLLNSEEQKIVTAPFHAGTNRIYDVSVNVPVLISAFQKQSKSFLQKIILDYFTFILEKNNYSMIIAREIVFEWLSALNQVRRQLEIPFLTITHDNFMSDLSQKGYEINFLKDQIERLALDAMKQYATNCEQKGNRVAFMMKEYIDQYYATKIGLSTFTEQFYLNKDYLSRIFKTEYGIGLYEYLLIVRMEHAKDLLEHTNLKIKEIAERTGFPDNNYFSKAFKNHFGYSPKDLRQS